MSERADDGGSTDMTMAGGEDRISALPDDVLRHLLSFLPSRNSVRTCVLAKRWRTLWKSVPALRIKDDPLGRFTYEGPDESVACSLKLAPYLGLTPLLDTMQLLVTASVVDVPEYEHYGEESFSVVLEGLSSATNLELTTPCYQNSVFRMDLKWCPMFSKLKTLLLNGWCLADNCAGMVYFLQHSPILETFTLQLDLNKYEKYYLRKTYESFNSREQGYNSRDQSLLLKHLKVVKIICGKKEDMIVQSLLKILCTHGVPSEQIDIQ
ncbi:hypothetical protein ACQ4PT_059613 [Festuca glaucescens]